MDTAALLSAYLEPVEGDPDYGDSLVSELSRLGRNVALAVPSLLELSIVLRRFGGDVILNAHIREVDSGAVLASLAMPLPAHLGATLVMQASEAGAFLLLEDDLTRLLGPDQPRIVTDQHVDWLPTLSHESLAGSLADLAVANRGVGVLVEQGWAPAEAELELERRAAAAGVGVAVASRRLLGSLPRPPKTVDP